MVPSKILYEPLPNQNNPNGANSNLAQGTLTSTLANTRTTVPIADPLNTIIDPWSTLVQWPSYAGRANWFVRQNGPLEIGSVPYAISGYVGHNSSTSIKFKFNGDAVHFDWRVS